MTGESGTTQTRFRVAFLTTILTHYRLPFHIQVREYLGNRGIEYSLIYGQPDADQSSKGDTIEVPWGTRIRNTHLKFGPIRLVLQWAVSQLREVDLVVVGQENKSVLNYLLLCMPRRYRPRVAFFGHGRNFQATNPNSYAERWKRYWAKKADWWFAYTEETKRVLESFGFTEDRITVFNNAIDTTQLSSVAKNILPQELFDLRKKLGLTGARVCIYVGGMYPEKRLVFLIKALDLVRLHVPDFEFIAVGGGPDLALLQSAAKSRNWLKVTGPKFGREKVELMSLAQLFLIPGLVGLAILDAGTMGLPVVTTDYPYHSPEIAYLSHGQTGLIVKPWTDVETYARSVIDLLSGDPQRLATMRIAAKCAAESYTIEAMAKRFAEGVVKALKA